MKKVRFCWNCFGLEPCWCNNKDYRTTWEIIYKALRKKFEL